ncbi:hypothetical protein KIL84_003686 [Mauremys mutica]|uniref:Uncharacterized protein n=1 Tax=Mauremys mutica TaxID=74926 RepID=A0A9D3WVN3_9SAUR|nr:hypothetical protein KIL84_003686 [Mauremys mutica]
MGRPPADLIRHLDSMGQTSQSAVPAPPSPAFPLICSANHKTCLSGSHPASRPHGYVVVHSPCTALQTQSRSAGREGGKNPAAPPPTITMGVCWGSGKAGNSAIGARLVAMEQH